MQRFKKNGSNNYETFEIIFNLVEKKEKQMYISVQECGGLSVFYRTKVKNSGYYFVLGQFSIVKFLSKLLFIVLVTK